MTFTVNYPQITPAVDVAIKYLNQNGGFYYEILDDSGGQTYARIGNPTSQAYIIEFVNVPSDRVGLLQKWLLDIWNYWMATSTSAANYDNYQALYKKASLIITPKQMLSAHAGGKALTPEQSAKYVVGGKDVFSGNIFQKNQREYERYLEKHVKGYKKEEVIQDIQSYIHNLEVMNKDAYYNYIQMLQNIIDWLNKGQIDVDAADKQAQRIYKQALSYKPRGSSTEVQPKLTESVQAINRVSNVSLHDTQTNQKVQKIQPVNGSKAQPVILHIQPVYTNKDKKLNKNLQNKTKAEDTGSTSFFKQLQDIVLLKQLEQTTKSKSWTEYVGLGVVGLLGGALLVYALKR